MSFLSGFGSSTAFQPGVSTGTGTEVKKDMMPANMSSMHNSGHNHPDMSGNVYKKSNSASGPPISSAQLYDMADWIASHYEGVVMRKEMKNTVMKSSVQKSSSAIPEYDDNKVYAVNDTVRFMNRTWVVKDAVGKPGHKPPTEPNVTFNNTWELAKAGGRRKTKNKRKHSRRR